MKKGLVLFVFTCCFVLSIMAQNTTEREIEKIEKSLVAKMNKNTAIKKVVIKDFTIDKKATKLGIYLAQELALAFSLDDTKSFEIIDSKEFVSNNKTQDTSGVHVSAIGKFAEKVGTEINNNNNNSKSGNLINTGGKLLNEISKVKNPTLGKKEKKTNVDAILTAEMTDNPSDNEIRLIFKVTDLANVVQVIDKGYITKTITVMEMSSAKKESGTTSTAIQEYKKDNISINLLECRQVGQTIECGFEIVNNGRLDIDLYVYGGNQSRSLNKEGGYEYFANSVKLADKINSNNVQKTIVPSSPVSATIIFSNVRETVLDLSKVALHCYTGESGYFDAEFSEIPVEK